MKPAQSQTDARPPAERLAPLPPGQHQSESWPVLDLGVHPKIGRTQWQVECGGLLGDPRSISFEELIGLPQVSVPLDLHCVSSWSVLGLACRGVRLNTLALALQVSSDAQSVHFKSYDGYSSSCPLSLVMKGEVYLIHEANAQPLSRPHGGPVRIIIPTLYAWKSPKWIQSIQFSAEEVPGYWEERGYHRDADPWREERFA